MMHDCAIAEPPGLGRGMNTEPGRGHVKALFPVMSRPTMRVCMVSVPS
jgi:hypothetical protein